MFATAAVSALVLATGAEQVRAADAAPPVAAPAAAQVPAGPAVSPAATKLLLAAQQAADAGKYDEVIAKVQELLNTAGRTPADAFVANQFLALAYNKQGNKSGILTALQGQLDSGYPDAAEQARINVVMVRTAYELKDYAKAAEYGDRLVRSGAADPATYGLIGDALSQQGKNVEASKLLGEHVAEQERSGQLPRERTLNTLFSAQEKAGDKAGVTNTLEKLVTSYSKPDYWNLVLFTMTRDAKLAEWQWLQVYRLRQTAQTLQRCGDFIDMAETAGKAGVPGEAQAVAEKGIASNACTGKTEQDRLQALKSAAAVTIGTDRAALPKLETEGRAAATGELDVVVGSSYLGYGDNAKAAEALSRGIAKGGVKNLTAAQFSLGTAQLRAGNKADALKTFSAIKSDDPVTQRLARLWALQAR